MLDNVSTYSLFFDPRGDRDRPGKLLDDLVEGTVDVAIAWGPMAGYYAKMLNAPLELVPLEDEPGVPLSFDISMGVQKGNRGLKSQLEAAIDRRQTGILTILEEFGVPVIPTVGGSDAANLNTEPELPAATSAPRNNPFAGDADAVAKGKSLYFEVGCQGCHGGGGGGGMATSLIDDGWTFGSDDEMLFKLIKGEIPDQTMPVVYSVLEDDEVWRLMAFIRSIYAGDPSKINW